MNSLIFKFFYVGLFGMILLTGYEAAFLSFPRNEMALANERLRYLCSRPTNLDEPLRWYVTYAGSTEYITLFTRGKLTPFGELRYRIDTSIRGQYNLIIESVNISFAGKYKCSEGPSGSYVEAELAVIDSQPLCQANASGTDRSVVENDYLWIQCSISFSGNTTPSMIWIRKSRGAVMQNISNQRNQSMIVIQVNSTDNGETFTFKATFRQENNPREIVVMWNYTLNVLYTPRDLVVSPVKTVYEVGDRLECSSDGNPPPSYEWTDIGTNRTTYGSFLTIDEYLKPDQIRTFRCTAYNTVAGLRNNISGTVAFNVTGTATTLRNSYAALIGSIVTVTLLCMFIVMAVLVCHRIYAKAWTIKRCVVIADQEPDVVRSDPMTRDNEYYEIEDLSNYDAVALTSMSTDDRVTPQTQPAVSIYELIGEEGNETVTDGLTGSQQVHAPAYSKVNKNDRLLKTHQGSNTSDLQSTTRAADTTQTNYFGADGTEYTQVNLFGESAVAPTPNSSMFRPVDNYAMIDHTRRAPPPLPRL